MSTTVVPGYQCSCGRRLNLATHAEGPNSQPKEGSLCLCVFCGKLSIFNKDLVLVECDERSLTAQARDAVGRARSAIRVVMRPTR